jgi:symplekin
MLCRILRNGACRVKSADVRAKFAAVWLNEEWMNARLRKTPEVYTAHVESILSTYIPTLDAKDKSLSSFLSTLPEIPLSVIKMLEPLCEDSDRLIVGFLALRDLVETRPPMREAALNMLLELCTHGDRKVRVMAINTVKRWVPETPMAASVVNYALGVLRRLVGVQEVDEDGMEDGEQVDAGVQSKYLGDITADTVQQHVELVFALSRRQEDLFDDIFRLYPQMPSDIRDAVETALTPLIQSLGASPKLLSLLKSFPPGSDKLALRILSILSAAGSTPALVETVKGLMQERELDAKFVIPILGGLDKATVEKQVPRIVGLLENVEARDEVRAAFATILQKMTPVELLVLLHQEEAGLKPTIEGEWMGYIVVHH